MRTIVYSEEPDLTAGDRARADAAGVGAFAHLALLRGTARQRTVVRDARLRARHDVVHAPEAVSDVTAEEARLPRSTASLPNRTSMTRLRAAFAALALLGAGCAPSLSSALRGAGVPYLPRREWGAARPVMPMTEHRINRITIHHTATRHAPDRATDDKLRGLQRFSQTESALGDGRIKKPWADVPYHFYVAVDGIVAEARPWRFIGDSNTPYDPTGHLLIVLEGNFEEEEVTPAQQRSLERLVAVMARRFSVAPENVAAHKDFADTLCPGEHLYALLPRLREVAAAQFGPVMR